MRRQAPLLIAAAILPLLAAPALAPQALAQGADPAARPQKAPPAALPGLAGRAQNPVIPADPDQRLGPQDALFDAINRNDLATVRASLGQGASLSARNVLGQTPLDAAVDQNRAEIVYFLLAARGSGSDVPAGARRQAARGPAPAPSSAPSPAPAARPSAPAAAAPAAPLAPRLWANDGGTPKPEIGFLGFDAGRS